jgi:hypothetical protein
MANQVIMSILLVPGSHYIADAPLFCVQLPDNNFKTRLYDGRSPYITNSYFDYSTPITEPIQKIILDAIVYKRKTHLLQKWSNKTHHLLFR